MPIVNGFKVGPIGLGLMGLTWRPKQTPIKQAFELMNYALSQGSNYWNAGEFYGINPPTANLDLLADYFEKYPKNADKVFLSVKGGTDFKTLAPHGDPESVTKSVKNALTRLRGKKKLDLFQCARVDHKVPIETTMKALKAFVDSGEISCVGLSEASAESIKRAHAIVPIAAVETEYSLFSRDIEKNGILDTCTQLSIPIIAYAPFCHGLLTGRVKTAEDLKDFTKAFPFLRNMDKFNPKVFDKNIPFLKAVEQLAQKFGMSMPEFALNFIIANGKGMIIPIPGSTTVQRAESNLSALKKSLSSEQLEEAKKVLDKHQIFGLRYNKQLESTLSI
ncbi:Pyridoxal reductase [Schizosaccharomyces pombe]